MADEEAKNQTNDQAKEHAEQNCDCPWCSLKEHWEKYSESEAWQHFSKAQEEFLLGVKVLIERQLGNIQAKSKPAEPRVTKVKVE